MKMKTLLLNVLMAALLLLMPSQIKAQTPPLDTADDFEVTAMNADEIISTTTSVMLESVSSIATFNNGNTTKAVHVFPNPFTTSINAIINNESNIISCELKIYNVLGVEVISTTTTKQIANIETAKLQKGVYFYTVIVNDMVIQSGKLISHQD